MDRKSRADRLYRLLLRLFPSEFRGDFGGEMSSVFREERADAAALGRFGLLTLWWRTLGGIVRTAPREHAHLLVADAGYGLRLMRKHPLTTAAAILTIALGVGANTAMFTVVNAVILQLPFTDSDRLAFIRLQTDRGYSSAVTVTQFRLWAERIDAVESMAGYAMSSPVLTGAGEPDRLRLECVSASMFPLLGVSPAIGRGFLAADDRVGAAPVIVVSHTFWASRLGRHPRSLGRVLTLDGAPVTVVGVMPKAFDGPRALRQLDGWVPLSSCLGDERQQQRTTATIMVFARLKRGVPTRLAEERLAAAAEHTGSPSSAHASRVLLDPLTDQIHGEIRQPLLALTGAAGFVLLIACANVASLMLGRVQARGRELALRAALGCSRGRMLRQLLTESLLLALGGGAAGLLIANWSLGALLAVMPGSIRRIDHIALDEYVLAACLVISTATGVLVGLFPAMYASRTDPATALKDTAPGGTPARRRVRSTLIVAEIALSLALLVGAGLLVKTFLHLRPTNPGFEPQGKVTATFALPRSRYANAEAWTAFEERLRERLRQYPGVQAVEAVSHLPLSGFGNDAEVQHRRDGSPPVTVHASHVTADYLSAMAISILRGRGFTASDGPGANVAIVNETMARRLWGDEDPIGRQLVFTSLRRTSTKTIVGIARDVRNSGRRLTAGSEIYVPFADEPVPTFRIVVKTHQSAEEMTPVIRQAAAALDPLLPVGSVIESLAAIVDRAVATWRFAASLLAAFAGIAVTLAAVGLFAVVSSWVTERTPEIGVRIALGAGRGRVIGLFLARSALLTAIGLATGLVLAALTTRFLAAWLVETSPLDARAFAGAALAMAAVCLLATYVAAQRATRVDPLTALQR